MTVPDVIKAIRTRIGASQGHFGTLLGVAQGTVSKYEAGDCPPSRAVLKNLASFAVGAEKTALSEAIAEVGIVVQTIHESLLPPRQMLIALDREIDEMEERLTYLKRVREAVAPLASENPKEA